jgi:hypothetical protein
MTKYLVKTLLFLVVANLNSQTNFSHELELGYSFLSDKSKGPQAFYSPRYNFKKLGSNASLSLGTRIGIGLIGEPQDKELSKTAVEVPLLIELQVGRSQRKNENKGIGFFLGTGPSILATRTSDGTFGYGIMANAGFRLIGIKSLAEMESLGFRFGMFHDFSKNELNAYSITLVFSL